MKLNFDEYGHGAPPLVILHGVFGSSTNWRSLARRLAETRRVLAVDLRNHGESFHAEEMTYRAMVEDLTRFIDDHCDGRADVLGHSMGGKAAMSLALIHPGRVNRLIAVDIAPVDYQHGDTFGRLIEGMQSIPLEEIESRSDADHKLKEYVPERGVRAFLLQNLRRDDDGWRWRINLEAICEAIDDIAGFPFDREQPYRRPTLFIGGAESEYLDRAHRRAVEALFPEARIEMVEGAGHWVHAEKPEAVLNLVESFLDAT